MITLRYALTAADFSSFSTYVQLDAPGKKKVIYKRLLPIMIVFGIICGINIYTSVITGNFTITDLIPFVVFAALFLFPIVSARMRLQRQAESFAANPQNARMFSMVDHYFSEAGVIIKDDAIETKFQWSAFIRKDETRDHIFLFVYSSYALIIPKRVFRSEVEKEELSKLFSQYISFDAEMGHLVKS
ncbi:YcxB family protein [Ferruginibacter sp.]